MTNYDQLAAVLKQIKGLSPSEHEKLTLCNLELNALMTTYGDLGKLSIQSLALHQLITEEEQGTKQAQ
jgi:hypothetical protein